ncbi:hypothetical protein [Ruegeria sp. MALMAid1280]|uniref:hypothetical protein n=1 Tax=Ruegeria sp. MALMAid1280 TaxID=3411634 RepID=UPI003BA2B5C4
MQIRTFLNRFKAAKPVRGAVSEDMDATSALGRRVPPIKKSELTALFQTVLEEKRDDLPAGRK